MSREYIKTGAGAYTPVADTQGFYAPSELRFCGAARTDVSGTSAGWTTSAWARFPLLWDTNARFGGENWVDSSNRIVAPETGLYLITASGRYGTPNMAMNRHAAVRINGGFVTSLYNAIHTETLDWGSYVIAGQAWLNAGDNVDLAFKAEVAAGTEGALLIVWDGFLRVALLQKSAPYIVANKGALVSSSLPGGVDIDADTGVMRVNSPDIDETGAYCVSRPDVWPTGQEVIFPGNVRGIRFAGSYDTGAANTWVNIELGSDTVFARNITTLLSYGGHMGGCANFSACQFPVNTGALATLRGNSVALTNAMVLKPTSVRQLYLVHTDGYASITTSYDVWALYVVS